jgi:hypothetical protein
MAELASLIAAAWREDDPDSVAVRSSEFRSRFDRVHFTAT